MTTLWKYSRRFMLLLFFGLTLLYILACIVLWSQQRRLLFFPQPAATSSIAKGLMLTTSGVALKIWHLPATNPPEDHQPIAILYFDGNASAAEQNLPIFQQQFASAPLHADVFIMNYRGYGGSEGEPTEAGLTADGLALYDHIHDQLGHRRIVVMGRSLGSGIATYVTAHREVDKLILVTAYDSIVNIAAARFWMFPVRVLMTDQFRSVDRVSDITAPTLLLTASADQVVPGAHTAALKAAFPPAQVQEQVFPGRRHNDLQLAPDYFPTIIDFLRRDTS